MVKEGLGEIFNQYHAEVIEYNFLVGHAMGVEGW